MVVWPIELRPIIVMAYIVMAYVGADVDVRGMALDATHLRVVTDDEFGG